MLTEGTQSELRDVLGAVRLGAHVLKGITCGIDNRDDFIALSQELLHLEGCALRLDVMTLRAKLGQPLGGEQAANGEAKKK